MKSHLVAVAAVLIVALASPDQGAGAEAARRRRVAPARAPSRCNWSSPGIQGDKKVSSLPYRLTVHPDERNRNVGRSNIRLGTQVPITTMTVRAAKRMRRWCLHVQYRDIGTSIDCIGHRTRRRALQAGSHGRGFVGRDARARCGTRRTAGISSSFRTADSILLRDGQSSQYSTATDKVSGEVWKVDVTLNVVK